MSMTIDRDFGVTVDAGDVINEILPFCNLGVIGRDLLAQADYAADPQRPIGHQPGIARQEFANKHARQTAHMAAGFAQFLARRDGAGVLDDGDLDKVEEIIVRVLHRLSVNSLLDVFLCNTAFKFLTANPPAGFVPCHGTLIAGAADRYPKAWARLQSADLRHLLCTEAEWQAMSTAVYYTDAAGNNYSWDGIGGVCRFVLDLDTGSLRVPDLRGLHEEAAGYNSLAVGQVARDEMRQITGVANFGRGSAGNVTGYSNLAGANGSFYASGNSDYVYGAGTGQSVGRIMLNIDTSRQAPIGPRTSPARYGVLPCVYLGS